MNLRLVLVIFCHFIMSLKFSISQQITYLLLFKSQDQLKPVFCMIFLCSAQWLVVIFHTSEWRPAALKLQKWPNRCPYSITCPKLSLFKFCMRWRQKLCCLTSTLATMRLVIVRKPLNLCIKYICIFKSPMIFISNTVKTFNCKIV